MSYNSGVIVLVISNNSLDYSLNCTPLSPITITNQQSCLDNFFTKRLKPDKVGAVLMFSGRQFQVLHAKFLSEVEAGLHNGNISVPPRD